MSPHRAVAIGCAILVVGMVILAVALHFSSLAGLIAAAVVSGIGQGISFSRGLAAVAERTPPERRAEVSSTYFVVAYVAISLPVVGEGLAAQHWGLRTAGVSFAVAVGGPGRRSAWSRFWCRRPGNPAEPSRSECFYSGARTAGRALDSDGMRAVPEPGRRRGEHPADS